MEAASYIVTNKRGELSIYELASDISYQATAGYLENARQWNPLAEYFASFLTQEHREDFNLLSDQKLDDLEMDPLLRDTLKRYRIKIQHATQIYADRHVNTGAQDISLRVVAFYALKNLYHGFRGSLTAEAAERIMTTAALYSNEVLAETVSAYICLNHEEFGSRVQNRDEIVRLLADFLMIQYFLQVAEMLDTNGLNRIIDKTI